MRTMTAAERIQWQVRHVLRARREERGWQQEELAEAAGIHPVTYSRIESGRTTNTGVDTMEKLAKALGLSLAELYADIPNAEAVRDGVDISDGYKPKSIPVVAEGEASPAGQVFWDAAAGTPLIDVEEWMSRPFDVTDPRAYGVRVRGDSMVPAYYPGMLLVVTPNTPVKSGARVYVELHNGEHLVKVARRQAAGWILESLNPAYEPRYVADHEVATMHKIAYAREL